MYKQSIYNIKINTNNVNYYYNSLSGELIKVNSEVCQYIEDIETNLGAESFVHFAYLFEKGFIVNQKLNEFERTQDMKNELIYSSNFERASYVIAVTTECNYKCVYCYENDCEKGEMTLETANDVVSFIINQSEHNKLLNTISITWFGGEPLLAIDIIDAIGTQVKDYCKKNNIFLTTDVITNGYLLNENAYKILKKFNLSNIQITLDGEKELYNRYKAPMNLDAYEVVLKNIKDVSHDCKITIRLNCIKENYESLKNLCRFFVDSRDTFALDNITFALSKVNFNNSDSGISIEEFTTYKMDFLNFLTEIGLANNVKSYLPSPRTIPCGLMQKTSFVIDNSGNLFKCEHFVGKQSYSIGNVKEGLLFPEIQQKFLETPLYDNCSSCVIYPLCRGGCSQKRFIGEKCVSCEEKKREIEFILRKILG